MVLLPSTEPNTALVGDSIELADEIDGRKRRGGGDGIVRAAVGPNTRLKEALGLDPRVVDYIVSLNPHDFQRLRNPLMRRLMSPRITLSRVAVMAGMPVGELLEGVAALGGVAVKDERREQPLPQSPEEEPLWVSETDPAKIRTVDLLPLDDALEADPMLPVMREIKALFPGEVLLIKHRWEPQPFYDVWTKMGNLEWFAEQVGDDEWRILVRRISR